MGRCARRMVRYVTGEKVRNTLKVFTDGRKRCVRRRSGRGGMARARLGQLAPAQEEASQVADVVITRATVVVTRAAVVVAGATVVMAGAAVVIAGATVVVAGATRRPRGVSKAGVCRRARCAPLGSAVREIRKNAKGS